MIGVFHLQECAGSFLFTWALLISSEISKQNHFQRDCLFRLSHKVSKPTATTSAKETKLKVPGVYAAECWKIFQILTHKTVKISTKYFNYNPEVCTLSRYLLRYKETTKEECRNACDENSVVLHLIISFPFNYKIYSKYLCIRNQLRCISMNKLIFYRQYSMEGNAWSITFAMFELGHKI